MVPRRKPALYAPQRALYQRCMTNGIAIGLVIAVAAFFALDHFVLQWGAPLFLARQFADLLHWVAFWR